MRASERAVDTECPPIEEVSRFLLLGNEIQLIPREPSVIALAQGHLNLGEEYVS